MYAGTCIELDEEASVCRIKLAEGTDTWYPLDYVHKLVMPTADDYLNVDC